MRETQIKTAADVGRWRLCMGCGACVPACPTQAIGLVDVCDQGLRPVIDWQKCGQCGVCVAVCPGVGLAHTPFAKETISELRQSWGPVLEVWEGYAADEEIRYKGASGGLVTAIALYCLEKQAAGVILHTGAAKDSPLRNTAVLSRTREELLMNCGSRYAPAAPCERLDYIKSNEPPCVFIGKPCDVAAVRKYQAIKPGLREKVALTISLFCAGTPATAGTLRLLKEFSVEPDRIENIRYRGYGWPGETTVRVRDEQRVRAMSYAQAWGKILSGYIQFRCRICPDLTGEFADISCGDAWHRDIEPNDLGWSLVLVRTDRGREILDGAVNAGHLVLRRLDVSVLPRSQGSLQRKRQKVWGQLAAMRTIHVQTPGFSGFSLLSNWAELSPYMKLRSILSTLQTLFVQRWFLPSRPVEPGQARSSAVVGQEGCRR